MNLFYFIILSLIFVEVSILLILNFRKTSYKKRSARKIYVDTSALMDGRILSIARTGFIGDNLIIPRSVIREMQLLADGKDNEKRIRARAGLDIVNELERVEFFDVEILQDELDKTPVDERLIELSKENDGVILTCDYNLSKVAKTEKIVVLNVNELALALRSEFLPGDEFFVRITGEGSNKNQGIGYLPDGTMVVVENAAKNIGKEIPVEFVRYTQTAAGKMMFGKVASSKVSSQRFSSRNRNNRIRRTR